LEKATFSSEALGRVINIGPDEEFITINTLAKYLSTILDFELDSIYMPGRPQEVVDANCSANLARKILDYETKVNLKDGLLELVEWIKSRGVKPFDYHLPLEIVTEATPRTWRERIM
jgi:UDP-glucose 4-epimerase